MCEPAFNAPDVFVLLVTDCAAPLGMENGTIQDSEINASSAYNVNFGPQKARLHMKEKKGDGGYRAGWRPKTDDKRQWIEINLKKVMKITKIATQGGYDNGYTWVKSFSLSYRVGDQGDFHDYQNSKVRTWTFSRSK